jgi:hypothetical protein
LSGAVFIRIKGNKNTGKEMFELGLCWLWFNSYDVNIVSSLVIKLFIQI